MMRIFNEFKDIDNSIFKLMRFGFKFSFIFGLFFTYILYFYALNPVSHIAFDIGYLGVKCCLMFFVSFFVGAFVSNKIKNDIM